jgi:NAD(P)-dependent dehydrogenase (short-subunit alcohol dehydrogenase family)
MQYRNRIRDDECSGCRRRPVIGLAKELSRRLRGRGIAVNSLHPGATRGTGVRKSLGRPLRVVQSTMQLFMKSASQGAATQALLAASPQVTGVTGEYWSDCQIAEGSPRLNDTELATRLWEVSAQIVSANNASQSKSTLAPVRMRETSSVVAIKQVSRPHIPLTRRLHARRSSIAW